MRSQGAYRWKAQRAERLKSYLANPESVKLSRLAAATAAAVTLLAETPTDDSACGLVQDKNRLEVVRPRWSKRYGSLNIKRPFVGQLYFCLAFTSVMRSTELLHRACINAKQVQRCSSNVLSVFDAVSLCCRGCKCGQQPLCTPVIQLFHCLISCLLLLSCLLFYCNKMMMMMVCLSDLCHALGHTRQCIQ